MGIRALSVCLVSFLALWGAFFQNASAQVFPEKFVKSMRGELSQGGLVILTLQPDARALYDGRTLPQYENQVVLGFGRDAPLEQSLLFTRGGTARAVDFIDESMKPVFEPGLITLQAIFAPLVTYSAAVIAYVEANVETDDERNELCKPVPLADTPADGSPQLSAI